MNIIKTLLTGSALLLILYSGTTYAGGPLDGIYSCRFSSKYGNINQIFVAANSNATTTIVTIPNLPGVQYDGYVAGPAASATAFNGTSSYGYPYTITATGATGAKQLSVSGTLYTSQYGPITGTGTCSQVI